MQFQNIYEKPYIINMSVATYKHLGKTVEKQRPRANIDFQWNQRIQSNSISNIKWDSWVSAIATIQNTHNMRMLGLPTLIPDRKS